jgi:hypothetical protein
VRAISVLVVAASATAFATGDASAKLVVRLTVVPKRPAVGTTLTLFLRTYVPYVDAARPCGFRLGPWRVSYPFRVQALAPDGTAYRVRVRQDQANSYVGQLRLPHKQGKWSIRVLNFFSRYNDYNPCSGAIIRVDVRGS